MKRIFIISLVSMSLLVNCKKEAPKQQDPLAPTKITYKSTIEGTIQRYCSTCHSPERTYNYANAGNLNTYTELVKRVNSGTLEDYVLVKKSMPPQGFPKPNSDELKQLQDWLDNDHPLE